MIVIDFNNQQAILSLDPVYAKILVEFLRVGLSDNANKTNPTKTRARLKGHGMEVPDEQIVAGMQTLCSVLARFTDQIQVPTSENGSEESVVDKEIIH